MAVSSSSSNTFSFTLFVGPVQIASTQSTEEPVSLTHQKWKENLGLIFPVAHLTDPFPPKATTGSWIQTTSTIQSSGLASLSTAKVFVSSPVEIRSFFTIRQFNSMSHMLTPCALYFYLIRIFVVFESTETSVRRWIGFRPFSYRLVWFGSKVLGENRTAQMPG